MANGSDGVVGAKIVVGSAFAAAAWTLIASLVFLLGTGLIGSFSHPFYQWWTYFFLARDNPIVATWLDVSGGAATALLVVYAVALAVKCQRVGPSIRSRLFGGPPLR